MTMHFEDPTTVTIYKFHDMEVIINEQFPEVDCHVSVTNVDTDGTYHNVHLSDLETI